MPKMNEKPEEMKALTLLLQAKLDIVSELRIMMVNGEPRSAEWKSLNAPKLHQLAESAGYQDAKKARALVSRFMAEKGMTVEDLEAKMKQLSTKVYAEAVADAWGWPPLYMRIDLLLDKQGRVWLGERESWGADNNGNDTKEKMNPTYKELTQKMIAQSKQYLAMARKGNTKRSKFATATDAARKLSKRKAVNTTSATSPTKRKAANITAVTSPTKRRRSIA